MSYFKNQLLASLEGVKTQISFQESMEAYYEADKVAAEIATESLTANRTESILEELTMQNIAIESIVRQNGRLTEGEAAAFEAARRSAAIALGLGLESYSSTQLIDTVGLESMTVSGSPSLEGVKEVLEKIKQAFIRLGKWIAEKFKAFVSFLRKSVRYHSQQVSAVYKGLNALTDDEYNKAKDAKEEEIKKLEVTDKNGKLVNFVELGKQIQEQLAGLTTATLLISNTAQNLVNIAEKKGPDSINTEELTKQYLSVYKAIKYKEIVIGPCTFKFDYLQFVNNAVRKAAGESGGAKGFEQIFNQEEDVAGALSVSRKEFLSMINLSGKIEERINALGNVAEEIDKAVNQKVVPKLSKLIDDEKKGEKVNSKVIFGTAMRIVQGGSLAAVRLLNEFNTTLSKTCKAGNLIIKAAGKGSQEDKE